MMQVKIERPFKVRNGPRGKWVEAGPEAMLTMAQRLSQPTDDHPEPLQVFGPPFTCADAVAQGEMTAEFDLGDVVRLKSGGQLFTVAHRPCSGKSIDVIWMRDGQIEELTLPAACFELAAPEWETIRF